MPGLTMSPRLIILDVELKENMHAAQHTKSIQGHAVALSAAEKLPPEMLSEIFIHCLDRCDSYMLPDPSSAPLLLTRVCRTWRACAIATPCLWTSFKLPAVSQTAVYDALAFLANRWVERSGARPISLSLNVPSTEAATPRFLPIHLPRCQHLHLSAPANIYSSLPETPLPFLETLSLALPREPAFSESILTAFGQAPQLRSLVIDDLTGKGFAQLSIPWSQLTELRVDGFEPTKRSLEVLGECTALKSCTLSPGGEVLLVGGPPTPITFPSLETLRIHPKRVLGFIYALDHFDVPALRHLEISIPGHIVPLFRELAPLLKRSRCPLESLSVSGFRMDVFSDFGTLCELVPGLRRLSVDGIGRFNFPSKQLFDALTCRKGGHEEEEGEEEKETLLPELEMFKIHLSVGPDDYPEEAIEEMIRSRTPVGPSGPRLREADVHLQRRQHDWIASLVNNGTRWTVAGGGEVVKECLD